MNAHAHLTGPEVNLTTHVHDVVNHILYEDLDDITLLGFSYGGFVVTGALEHIASRVRHLVFLDAFVPRADGDTVWSAVREISTNHMIASNRPAELTALLLELTAL